MDADNAALDIPVVVVLEPSGRQATVRLHGEVDVEVEPCIVEAVHRTARLEGLAAIDVDATGVTFIDSSGLRALVLGAKKRARAAFSTQSKSPRAASWHGSLRSPVSTKRSASHSPSP